MTKAYRIKGLEVKLDYDPELLKQLKDKYPEGGSVTIGGDKGLKVGFNYSGVSTLTVKLPTNVYIAGEFSRIQGGTVGLTGEGVPLKVKFKPEKVNANTSIGQLEQVAPSSR